MARSSKSNRQTLQLYLARGGSVHRLTLTPAVITGATTLAFLLVGWLFASTAFFIFHQEIREAKHHYLLEQQRSYEDRIAALRRQIDALNSRRYLDQAALEDKIATLRERQVALARQQAQVNEVIEGARERDFTFEIRPDSEQFDNAEVITGSTAAMPALAGRPMPTGPDAYSRPRLDPPAAELADIDGSVERIKREHETILNAVEARLSETTEQLVALPDAIDAEPPSLNEVVDGVGGPFVPIRGGEDDLGIASRIDRIEQRMVYLDALRQHVKRLPVRFPLKEKAAITSSFGSRVDPFLGRRAMHNGIDFRAGTGTPVLAAAKGRVVRAGRLGGYGNLIEIDHGEGRSTRYAHLSRIDVNKGQSVDAGQVIGAAGSTGRSTGPHLHYETWIDGQPVDPKRFVEAANLLPEGY